MRRPSLRDGVEGGLSRVLSRHENCIHWSRRFLVRSSLVHDVLRVVLARVGLRRRVCEQRSKPESNEGLPQQPEKPPSAPPEVAHR